MGARRTRSSGCVVPPERLDETPRCGEYLVGSGHGAAFLEARADSSS